MARIRLKYVNEFVDRHGKPRYYFRRPRKSQREIGGVTRLR
jgi:hypothetical protein